MYGGSFRKSVSYLSYSLDYLCSPVTGRQVQQPTSQQPEPLPPGLTQLQQPTKDIHNTMKIRLKHVLNKRRQATTLVHALFYLC